MDSVTRSGIDAVMPMRLRGPDAATEGFLGHSVAVPATHA
jgi:hypothetical protein